MSSLFLHAGIGMLPMLVRDVPGWVCGVACVTGCSCGPEPDVPTEPCTVALPALGVLLVAMRPPPFAGV